jgi:hypothetical protein
MVDGHHPNLQGYIVISRLVATEIRKRLDPGGTPLPALDEGKARVAFGIDGRKDFEVAISRGRWFTRLATWRYDPGRRLARAEELFRTALHLDSSRPEPYLGLAMVHFLRREAEAGDGWLTAAREKDAAEVKRYLGESWVQSVITRAHRSGSTREGRSTSVTARTAG